MTYWFVRSQPIQPLTLAWDTAKHQQTTQRLQQTLADLQGWLANYPQQPFPQRPDCPSRCQTCGQRDRCWPPTPTEAAIASWDEIPLLEL